MDGFNDCLHQLKASFPGLDLAHVSMDALAQTLALLIYSESTDELFANDALVNDATVDLQGDEDSAPGDQQKTNEEGTHQPKDVQIVEEKDDDTPAVQQ